MSKYWKDNNADAGDSQSRAWIEKSPVCTKIVDPDFMLQFMSKGGVDALGIEDISELYGTRYPLSFYPDSFKEQMTECLETVRDTGQALTMEAPIADLIGNELWFSSTVSPIFDEDGVLDYYMIVSIEITKRIVAEKELIFNAARFNRWKESNFIGIIQSNAQGVIAECNDAMLAMIGYTRQEMDEGLLDWPSLTPPEYVHLDEEAMEEAAIKGYWTSFEKEYIHKEGHRVPIIIGGSVFKQSVEEFIVFVIDISKQKEIEEELRKGENRLRVAQKVGRIGSFDGNVHSDDLWWSDELFLLFGLDKENTITTKDLFFELIHPDDVEEYMCVLENSLTEGVDFRQQFRAINTLSGEWRHFETFGNVTFDAEGNVFGLQGTVQEITERKLAGEALEKSEQTLRLIFDAVSDGILIISTEDKRILSVNPKMTDFLGYTKDELFGMPISELEQTDNSEQWDKLLAETHSGDSMFFETQHKHRNGSLIDVEVSATGKTFQFEDCKAVLSIVRVITERKKLNLQVKHALLQGKETERNRIGKDLHDGLGQMLVGAELFSRSIKTGEKYSDETLDECKKLLKQAISECRGIAHGLVSPQVNKFSLQKIIRNLVNSVIASSGLEVDLFINLPEEYLPTIIKTEIYRIFQEILANCVKYSEASEVEVRLVQVSPQTIELAYSDNGVGFDIDKETEGMGIKNLFSRVNALEGKINIESKLNVGTEIKIILTLPEPN